MKKFCVKLSKPDLFKDTPFKQGRRPRAFQVYLALLSYVAKTGSYVIGLEYKRGFQKGQLCYKKDLKIFISRFTGLRHKQILRYLRGFEKNQAIYKTEDQFMDLAGVMRREIRLRDTAFLWPKPGESYLVLNLSGVGKAGFDIYGYLERCLREDSHPDEPENNLKFNIKSTTKWYREKSKTYKPKQQASKCSFQKMTPKRSKNRLSFSKMIDQTTNCRLKSTSKYEKKLCLLQGSKKIWVDWWKTKKADSENIKVMSGLDQKEKLLWYQGKLYRHLLNESYAYCFAKRPKKVFHRSTVPDCERHVPSAKETRQSIMDKLGLNLKEYRNMLIRANENRFVLKKGV